MTFKFLIDECLSPVLGKMAVKRGCYESTCVRDRGWQGTPDRELMKKVLAEDFTLVTNNSVDFRGGGPGNLGGHHAKAEVHNGLICLNAETGLDLDLQRALFAAALDLIDQEGLDLVNQALELFLLADGTLEYAIYGIPTPGASGVQAVQDGRIDFAPYLDQLANGMLEPRPPKRSCSY